jgi:hypothetical protein
MSKVYKLATILVSLLSLAAVAYTAYQMVPMATGGLQVDQGDGFRSEMSDGNLEITGNIGLKSTLDYDLKDIDIKIWLSPGGAADSILLYDSTGIDLPKGGSVSIPIDAKVDALTLALCMLGDERNADGSMMLPLKVQVGADYQSTFGAGATVTLNGRALLNQDSKLGPIDVTKDANGNVTELKASMKGISSNMLSGIDSVNLTLKNSATPLFVKANVTSDGNNESTVSVDFHSAGDLVTLLKDAKAADGTIGFEYTANGETKELTIPADQADDAIALLQSIIEANSS